MTVRAVAGDWKGRDFPWTWDQFQRYAALGEILAASKPADGRSIRVLDVGGVSPDRSGVGVWFPIRRIHDGPSVVCDVADIDARSVLEESSGFYVRSTGGALPFPDRAFDVAAALDVLEHVPAARREAFLHELCRVSSGLVVLSAPCRDPRVEAVESLLADQVRRLTGVAQAQLEEHRRYGLPDPGSVSEILGREMPAGSGVGFGSLADMLLFHYVRNDFLLRRRSGRALEALDRFLSARGAASIHEKPFARILWVYGRNMPQADLDGLLQGILKRPAGADPGWIESLSAGDLAAKMAAYHAGPSVSALVALPSGPKRLASCLDHLLSQEVDFDFEVCVWDPVENPDVRRLLSGSYPGVRVFGSAAEGATAGSFLKAVTTLRGAWTLLVSDRAQLPREVSTRLLESAGETGDGSVIAPRNVRRRYFNAVWIGGRWTPGRLLAGRIPRPSCHVPKPAAAAWLYSECLFFERSLIFSRRFPSGRLGRRDVFLWRASGRGVRPEYLSRVSVFIR